MYVCTRAATDPLLQFTMATARVSLLFLALLSSSLITAACPEFPCKTGGCADFSDKCDGVNNCVDGSDEDAAFCDTNFKDLSVGQRVVARVTFKAAHSWIGFTMCSNRTCSSLIVYGANKSGKLWGVGGDSCNRFGRRCTIQSISSPVGSRLFDSGNLTFFVERSIGELSVWLASSGGSTDITIPLSADSRRLQLLPGHWISDLKVQFFDPSPEFHTLVDEADCTNTENATVCQHGKIAKAMCAAYSQFVFEETGVVVMGDKLKENTCQNRAQTLIIDGTAARSGEFPHMALIGYGEADDIDSYQCGGSLIAPNFILTAAHCVADNRKRPARWVVLGVLNRTSNQLDPNRQLLEVAEAVKHPNYTSSVYFDIALLRLTRDATLGRFVRPACLYTERTTPAAGARPLATGWGATVRQGNMSTTLMKVALSVQLYTVCNETYRAYEGQSVPKGILDDIQFCAGEPSSSKDTCQGDSGGPLQIMTMAEPYYCMHHIIGVTSFGVGCGFKNYLGVYTRVSSFVPWIEKIVWSNRR